MKRLLVLLLCFSILLSNTNYIKAYSVQTDTNIKVKVKRKNACRYKVYCFSKYPLEKITVNNKKINLKVLKTVNSGKYANWKTFDVIKQKKNTSVVKIKNVDGKSKTKKFKIKFK